MKLWRSRRFWLALLVLMALLNLRVCPLAISIGILAVAHFFNPGTWRPLRNIRFWIVISLLVILVPLFTGDLESRFLGMRYSQAQLDQMLLMALRGIDVFLLFQILTTDLDSRRARQVLERLHLSQFDILFTISKESLPTIRSILKARTSQFRARGGRIQVRRLIPYAGTILQDMILLAEQLSGEEQLPDVPEYGQLVKEAGETPTLILVCADPGAGKSPWVNGLYEHLEAAGKSIGGIVSLKVRESEDSWHHEMQDLLTGDRQPLNTMDNLPDTRKAGKFSFYPGAFQWGCERIRKAVGASWVIVDEVGIMELQGKGLHAGLSALDDAARGHVVLTLRNSLVDRFQDQLPDLWPQLAQRPRIVVQLPKTLAALEGLDSQQ